MDVSSRGLAEIAERAFWLSEAKSSPAPITVNLVCFFEGGYFSFFFCLLPSAHKERYPAKGYGMGF